MQDRNIPLSAKPAEIQKQLEEWAIREDLLNPGEQIEFSLRIQAVPIVLRKDFPNAETMTIMDALLLCPKLGISRHIEGILRNKFRRGVIHLWDPDANYEMQTIADLVKLPGRDFMRSKNMGEGAIEALQKILKHLGIDWE